MRFVGCLQQQTFAWTEMLAALVSYLCGLFLGRMLKSSAISIALGGHEFFLHYDTAAGDAGFSASFPKCRALTLGRKGRSSHS